MPIKTTTHLRLSRIRTYRRISISSFASSNPANIGPCFCRDKSREPWPAFKRWPGHSCQAERQIIQFAASPDLVGDSSLICIRSLISRATNCTPGLPCAWWRGQQQRPRHKTTFGPLLRDLNERTPRPRCPDCSLEVCWLAWSWYVVEHNASECIHFDGASVFASPTPWSRRIYDKELCARGGKCRFTLSPSPDGTCKPPSHRMGWREIIRARRVALQIVDHSLRTLWLSACHFRRRLRRTCLAPTLDYSHHPPDRRQQFGADHGLGHKLVRAGL